MEPFMEPSGRKGRFRVQRPLAWREVVMQCIEDPPDVTGNPWPDCICNDARYELGHMEACPAYGRTPDAPAPG
jgi:hypothetical protein